MKVLSLLILTFVIGSIFSTSFHTSMGMEMGTTNTDCPFMAHEETMCPMSAFDHLSMLRGIFEATFPSIVSLTLLIGATLSPLVFTSKIKPNLLLKHRTMLRWRQRVIYTFSHRLFQDLFARGILNPKLFS